MALLASSHGAPRLLEDVPNSLNLASSALRSGSVPASLTCDGANTSPDLSWSAPPASTRSFALILTDPDAPMGIFVHWLLYNLPAVTRSLPAAFSTQPQLSDGTLQGNNDFGNIGYGGPCPPGHSQHRYVFDLYALDAFLSLPSGASRRQVEEAMKGHILARGRLVAHYGR